MEIKELLRAGDVLQVREHLQQEIRAQPAKLAPRVALFQVLSVLGEWERAGNQLGVIQELDPSQFVWAQMYGSALQCELFRRQVFEGKRAPLIFGEPEPWVAAMVESLALFGKGQIEAAGALREQALAEAYPVPGDIDAQPFEWISDADFRLGPLLEMILEGKYYFVPFSRLQELKMEEPDNLIDVVWHRAAFTWTNGGTSHGLIPTRYPGTEHEEDLGLRLARKTDWRALANDLQRGVGQRLLATDADDYPLLDTRLITFRHAE